PEQGGGQSVLVMKREQRDYPLQRAFAVNDEVSREDDCRKNTKDAAGQIEEQPACATYDFCCIFLQLSGVNLVAERQMLEFFAKTGHVPGPIRRELPGIVVNGWEGKDHEQRSQENQNQDEEDNGEAPARLPSFNTQSSNQP